MGRGGGRKHSLRLFGIPGKWNKAVHYTIKNQKSVSRRGIHDKRRKTCSCERNLETRGKKREKKNLRKKKVMYETTLENHATISGLR